MQLSAIANYAERIYFTDYLSIC